ncbi:MAG: hypothetical protein K9I74_14640 [Bacteroidales bacterium]|nr:hypothetical protein [Bacteroidales bacterium]
MKLTLKINKAELHALFLAINQVDFNQIEDPDKRIMTRHLLKKLYMRIAQRKLQDTAEHTLQLEPAYAAALRAGLFTVDALGLGNYEANAIMQILHSFDQKLLDLQ